MARATSTASRKVRQRRKRYSWRKLLAFCTNCHRSRQPLCWGLNMGSHTKAQDNSPASDSARRVLDSIRRIAQSIRLASRAAERVSGLSGAQLFVLQKLADGEAASLNDLAARTLTHQSSVSVVVQRLVDRKLVTRAASRDDARRVVLSLTPAGRALVRKSPQAAQERLIEAIESL